MHLVSFAYAGLTRIGVLDVIRGEVVDLSASDDRLPSDMLGYIAAGQEALDRTRLVIDSGHGRIAQSDVQLLAPIPRPARNIFCVGKNYRDHVKELQGRTSTIAVNGRDALPEKPIIFTKATSSVIGPNAPIPVALDPTASSDYEGELAVIIGRGGRGIEHAQAMQHVYGYSILNDVTSRRLQGEHQQWFLGKSIDGYCPMGPAILTADAIDDLGAVRIRTWVGSELRQDDVLASLIFDVPCLIETLSRTMTLEPGDIIATGTPAGVGMGFNPPRYLRRGDVVRITIDPIGTLENPVA